MGDFQNKTYTFLFTDIEGSTRLWEQFPEAMHEVISQHDAIIRDSIEANSGDVFKTIGDAFCAAFEDAGCALKAALAAQLKLHATQFKDVGSLRVRFALYTGEARKRDDDYFGTALNRVARLLAAGHGGQTLIAGSTAAAANGTLGGDAKLLDLGEHLLRDLEKKEQIFQLAHPSLPDEFPALRSIDALPNNLPRELTTFIGREQEIEEIKGMLKEHALVTLIGSGGCGKTRLALQTATDLIHKFEHGVWLVELAPLADASLVPQAIASALGVFEEPGLPILESLKKQLKNQKLLIVLDNCEHLIGACAQVADGLLRSAQHLKVLATSREALGVPGEATWKVPSLSLPDPTHFALDELLEKSEAVRLFAERAAQASQDFAVTEANASSLASICLRLDGIPLAIELAAARVKALPVEQIAARLDDRFRLLTGGSRTALPRHQTLRATIDWSYNLLSDQEKLLLMRLSVFTGGWTLEAAETVCAGDQIEDWEVLDLLTQLVDKSLVVYEESHGEGRYRLLETVRQYAREKAFDMEDATELRRRHARYFTEFAVKTEPKLSGPEQVKFLDSLEIEHDNFRAALEWTDSDSEMSRDCLQLAKSLARFWEVRGYYTEGRSWVEKALPKASEGEDDLVMRAYNQVGNICREQGDYAAAKGYFEKSLELARKLDFKRGLAILLNNLGITALNSLDFETAKQHYEESIEICREINDPSNLGAAIDNLGAVLAQLGDYARAREMHAESMKIFKSLNDSRSIAISLLSQGDLERMDGNIAAAETAYRESLRLMNEISYRTGLAACLEGFGIVLAERDQEAAGRLFGAASLLRERLGSPIPPQAKKDYEEAQAKVEASVGKDRMDQVLMEGRRMGTERAVDYALEA